MKKTVFVILILLSSAANLYAQDAVAPAAVAPQSSEEKLADVRRLIVLTGGEQLGKQMIADIVDAFKANYPDVPADFWNEFLNGNDVEKLISSNVAVYDKYLSHEDIKEIIKFYESPSGKKLIEVLPQISQESYTSGEEWGYGLGKKVRDRLIEKGYIKDEALSVPAVVEDVSAAEAPAAEAPAAEAPAAPAAPAVPAN